uniref:Uncharacterized protein n=1 Tax=Iridovirus LCIVAC01 TaxID=2506607 RepID=A0A481YQA9_9VIRU|nr:MAG: hypothetical protein LCIVAC01_01810 [Iridovirus LCIVAC01]
MDPAVIYKYKEYIKKSKKLKTLVDPLTSKEEKEYYQLLFWLSNAKYQLLEIGFFPIRK